MARLQATVINLSEHEKKILTQLKAGTHSPLHLKRRAEIILLSNEGETNNSIEWKMQISGENVTRWRNRYAGSQQELAKLEAETPKKLRAAIKNVLSDEKRPGKPASFTNEQIACILALACEQPEKLGLPFSHWTPTLLQTEIIKLKIVDSISTTHISRFLKKAGLKTASRERMAESEN